LSKLVKLQNENRVNRGFFVEKGGPFTCFGQHCGVGLEGEEDLLKWEKKSSTNYL
jgi:hypothetical protein